MGENRYFCMKQYYQMWDSYLEEQFKVNKMLAKKYNTKQAMIEALKRLGISEKFARNEILLQFLITEFSNLMEPFPFRIGSNLSKRIIDNLEKIFEDVVKSYISILKNKLIIEENDTYGLITILEHTYPSDYHMDKDIDLYLNKIINAYYFENGYIKKNEVLFDKQSGYTTVRRNITDIRTRYNKDNIEVFSTMYENTYDSLNKMLSDIEYTIEDNNFDIKNFTLANKGVYTYMESLSINDDLKTCKYIKEDKKIGLNFEEDIEVCYSKIGFDFMNFGMDNVTEETNLNYRTNELIDRQIEYYNSKNLDESDYLIQYDDEGFYSVVYEFFFELLEQINKKSHHNNVLKLHRIMNNNR